MNENRPNPRTANSLVIVAGDMICFVVGNKPLGSAGVSIKLSEKGSVKQTNLKPTNTLLPVEPCWGMRM